MAPCSFDAHVMECSGIVMLGGSVVLLRPEGHLDAEYLSKTIQQHHVTFMGVVPSLMTVICNYLIEINAFSRLQTIRSYGFVGKYLLSFLLRCQNISIHLFSPMF